jgi:hypothetical protein
MFTNIVTMVEKNIVVNNRKIEYQGIFKVHELFSTINNAINNKGYTKNEKKTEEMVTESGRKTYVELRPFKVKSNYYKLIIKIKIRLNNITEIKEVIDNTPQLFQQGNIDITIDSWIFTKFENKWIMKPWVTLAKLFINHYIYKLPEDPAMVSEVAGDTAHLCAEIKNLLNSYVSKPQPKINEEELKKEIEKEILEELE